MKYKIIQVHDGKEQILCWTNEMWKAEDIIDALTATEEVVVCNKTYKYIWNPEYKYKVEVEDEDNRTI